MKRTILGLTVVFLFVGFNVFAGDGDLIVNGNLGIGTTNPTQKLDVAGAISISEGTVETVLAPGLQQVGVDSIFWYGTILRFKTGATGPAGDRISILNNGNVGIGTANPSQKLDVAGAITISEGTPEAVLAPGFQQVGGDSILWYGNKLRIKTASTGEAGNRVTIYDNGDTAIGNADPQGYKLYVLGPVWGSGGYLQPSDAKFKTNVMPISNALDIVLRLSGVTFNWNEEYKDKGYPTGRDYGVIAQEVETVMPEAVREGQDGEKAVAYTKIIPVLIQAIKEQQREIEVLKAKVGQ